MKNPFITLPSPPPVRDHGIPSSPSEEGMEGDHASTNRLELIIHRSHSSSSQWKAYSREGQYLHHRISNHMRLPVP